MMVMMFMAEHELLNANNIRNQAHSGLNPPSIGIKRLVLVKHVAQIQLKQILDLTLNVPCPKRVMVGFINAW